MKIAHLLSQIANYSSWLGDYAKVYMTSECSTTRVVWVYKSPTVETMPVLKHFQINVVGVDDKGDSPLSMAASVVGIFTFAIALLGAMWLWVKLAVKAREELRVVEETRQW